MAANEFLQLGMRAIRKKDADRTDAECVCLTNCIIVCRSLSLAKQNCEWMEQDGGAACAYCLETKIDPEDILWTDSGDGTCPKCHVNALLPMRTDRRLAKIVSAILSEMASDNGGIICRYNVDGKSFIVADH
jgi:hypothetical protein